MRRVLGTCILAGASVAVAIGQVDAGTIAGTVRDTTGAVIAGAAVIVENVGTGLRIETSTGAQGIYVRCTPPPAPATANISLPTPTALRPGTGSRQ